MSSQEAQEEQRLRTALLAFLLATTLGSLAGWLMATLMPADKSSWVGLVLLPLWFLLELFFEVAAAVLGSPGKVARALAITGLLAGFYIVWFSVKGLAP
jgi:uncharacterized membrane protein YfcA